MPLNIVVGTQWGDEGKGRIVDLLSAQADFVARYNGGDNAGHTVTVGRQTFKLHLIPSGIIHPHTIGVIGNGVVINPSILVDEMEMLRTAGISITPERLGISHAAHLITPAHLALDRAQEEYRGKGKIGTTLRGIGPAYTDKVSRMGLRLSQMLFSESFTKAVINHVEMVNHTLKNLYCAETLDTHQITKEFFENVYALKPFIQNVSVLLSDALHHGKCVLAEGAQGTLLDLDHGTYPFVTSSYPIAAGAFLGLGLGVGYAGRVIGVTKAFQTRVGEGPFPSEVFNTTALHLRGSGDKPWDEYGTTTGRPRRVGWLDGVLLRYAVQVNGLTELVITKLDVLTGLEVIKVCVAYQDDNQIYHNLPFGPDNIASFKPVYEELPGWEENLWEARCWEDLPPQARNYILRIEEVTGTPVHFVSVGPEREQVVEIS